MCGFIFCDYYNYDTRPQMQTMSERIGVTLQISGNCNSWLSDSDIVLPLKDVKDKLKRLMPKLKLFVIKDSGHLPHKEQVAQFNLVFFNEILNALQVDVTSSEAIDMYTSEGNIFLDVRTKFEHNQSSIPNLLINF